ncbi:MAG: pyridoxal phosphate-dependent aminotransferase [Cyanobacteriota bacterium]|nr:pyridoxal phosphate-dependent aminotransferase [Cyanobacteriota bacterium]
MADHLTRMQAVQSPIIPIVADLIRQHPGTISLGQGIAYYGPPPQALEQIQAFLEDPTNHQYKAVQGIPNLITAIEKKLITDNQIFIEPDRNCIVVTAGSNMAFTNAVLAITQTGDEIILQSPYYFNHEMAIVMADCQPVIVPTNANYQLQIEVMAAAITPRTKAIVTISPNNPSGAIYPEADLRAVNQLCQAHGIYHIHDQTYEYFTYDGIPSFSPASILGSSDYTISLFSFSKAYGLAGWRVGYMVIPAALFFSVLKIQDTVLICPPIISQYAALGALQAGANYCLEKCQMIQQVRQIALESLSDLGEWCRIPAAAGAFYFLLQIDTPQKTMTVVERLIREHGVAVIPGTTFGMDYGCYLRVAYGALQRETAATGIGRLVKGLKAVVKGS